MNRQEINDPFHRDLFDALSETIQDRKDGLAAGSAKQHENDFSTVAEKYAAQCSYIQALIDVLALAEEIEVRRLGGRNQKE